MVDIRLKDINKKGNMEKESLSLGNALKSEQIYKTISYATLFIFIFVSFFLSLANASFDVSKILSASFWVDFSITFFGSQLLKWLFGKSGSYEGHKNKKVQDTLSDIESLNKEIADKQYQTLLKEFVEYNNLLRKLKALRKKVFHKLFRRPKNKKNLRLKECLHIYEQYMEAETEEDKQKYKEQLEEQNFDLENYKIKYAKIKESVLNTGIKEGGDEEAEKLSYSEFYQLFGKSSLLTLFSLVFTILIAIMEPFMREVSMETFVLFLTRVIVYVMNSFVGFIVAKNAVETIKLNILIKIKNFLSIFLESVKRGD